jgi:hypothetical protein
MVGVVCQGCQKPLRSGDEFCAACGAAVSEAQRHALRAQLEASNVEFFFHHKLAKSATKTIGAVALLFVVSGAIFFVIKFVKLQEALKQLDGQDIALRAALEREPWLLLGMNLFVAAIMGAFWLWSKRSVLPATISALGVYVALIVANAIYEPASIVQGLLVKIAVILALAKGVKSAVAARRIELAG